MTKQIMMIISAVHW